MKKYITLTTILFIVCGLTFTSCMDLYDDGEYKPASNETIVAVSGTNLDVQVQQNVDLFKTGEISDTTKKKFVATSNEYDYYAWYISNKAEPVKKGTYAEAGEYVWDYSKEDDGSYLITLVVKDSKGNYFSTTKQYTK